MLVLAGAVHRPASAATVSGVCGLITRQEAATALGAPVPAGTAKTVDLPLQGIVIKAEYCSFGSEVGIGRYELGSDAPALFGKYRQSLASKPNLTGYQNVTGLGDEAFAAKGQLTVRSGHTGIIIDVGQARGGGAKELQAEKTLAALVLGRL